MEGGGFSPSVDGEASGAGLSVGPFAGDDHAPGAGVAARPDLMVASGSGGCSAAARERKPMRWKRIPRPSVLPPSPLPRPRVLPPSELRLPNTARHTFVLPSEKRLRFPDARPGMANFEPPSFSSSEPAPLPKESGKTRKQFPQVEWVDVQWDKFWSKEAQERRLAENLEHLEILDGDDYDTEEDKAFAHAFKVKFSNFYRSLATTRPEDIIFNYNTPSDTQEEILTAEEMEMEANRSGWPVCPQAQHFATLALEHYNSTKRKHKFEMAKVLLSKCFSEVDGSTFAHVNFTAYNPQQIPPVKRLFFAELMLIPDKIPEPMAVLHVCTIDDSCFGGCHEIVRDFKESTTTRKDLDYSRCHACSQRIKHPRGDQFCAGHNRNKMPYVGVFPCVSEF